MCFQLTIEIESIEYQMKCVNLNNGHIWTVDSNEVSYGSKYKDNILVALNTINQTKPIKQILWMALRVEKVRTY
jgi:hypothetical protein